MIKNKKKISILDLFGILKDDKASIDSFKKSFRARKNLKLRDVKFD